MEKWGYQISYKKALDGKHKAIRQLFGDFSQSYTELPRLFLAIEQANPGCVVTGPNPDIPPGFPEWSRLVKSHLYNP